MFPIKQSHFLTWSGVDLPSYNADVKKRFVNRWNLGKDIFYYEWSFDKYTLEYDIFCLYPAVCPSLFPCFFPPIFSWYLFPSSSYLFISLLLALFWRGIFPLFNVSLLHCELMLWHYHNYEDAPENAEQNHWTLRVCTDFKQLFLLFLYLQAGGDPSSVVAASRQHPAGFAPPVAAVCPESIWWAGTWTAKSGSAAA